jgi:hypothetical protein
MRPSCTATHVPVGQPGSIVTTSRATKTVVDGAGAGMPGDGGAARAMIAMAMDGSMR